VQVRTAAILDITDDIKASVSQNQTAISGLNGRVTTNSQNIAALTIRANSISSTVSNHTTQIDTLSG